MEKVLVVDSLEIKELLNKEGIISEELDCILDKILNCHYYWDRQEAENCDSMKQIIPYAIIRCGEKIFVLKRLRKQTEKRLHGKLSIGIGGHINPDSEEHVNPIEHGLYKELAEEVHVGAIKKVELLGVINDLSTPVSNYHIGLLYEIWTDDNVYVLEKEKMEGDWMTIHEARTNEEYMESWSQIALEYIKKF